MVSRPEVFSMPSPVQPVASVSKVELAMRLLPLELSTWTLSIKHSPASCSNTCNSSAATSPLSIVPVAEMMVQGTLCVSSLSAQFGAWRWLACGSTNSRLDPPPADHWDQRPPVPQVTSSIVIWIVLVCGGPDRLVVTVVSDIASGGRPPWWESLPLKLPIRLPAFRFG